jgi:hypothetical protein
MQEKYDLNNLKETDIKLALYMQELFDGFLSNKGLQYPIDKTRGMFGQPVMLFDTSGKVLAASYDADSVFQFETSENGSRFLSDDTLMQIYSNKINDNIRKAIHSRGTLITSIKIDMIEIAKFVVYQDGIQYQDIDLMLMDKVSSLISSQLQKNILLNLDNNHLPNYILADLIEGKPINESIIKNKQYYLKWARTENIFRVPPHD